MAKIVEFFKQRWVLIFLGLCALSLIIHLVGPSWPIFASDQAASGYVRPLESSLSRWLATLFIFAVWGVVELIKLIRSTLAAARLKAAAAGADPSQAEHQIGQLESAFLKAVDSLEKNSKRTGKRSLTELPWYVVLGPSGVGKTELLRTSGLDFPFEGETSRKYVDGAGGTLNCKWWFTRDAILLDTAGRYVQQDQHREADRAEWERFLTLIRKHRRRQPLNGIVAVISADDVLRDYRVSREAMRQEARRLRSRIHELNDAFDMALPVYLVIAKCDLIAGFAEYFRDLNSDDARAQPWGFDLPGGATASSERLREELYDGFGHLINRLRHRALTRLRDERKRQRCVQIQSFAEQIDKLSMPVCDFIDLAFGIDEFGDAYRLRGVYLTSATQEGAPIDQLTSELSELFGVAEVATASVGGEGRSYFVRDLLIDKVFPERFITGVSRRWDAMHRWALRGAVVTGAAALVIGTLVWIAGFRANDVALSDAGAKAESITALVPAGDSRTEIEAILAYLDKARELEVSVAERRQTALFGNYLWLSELDNMRDAARNSYADALQAYFVPMMAARFDIELQNFYDSPGEPTNEPWFDTDLQYQLVKFIKAISRPAVLNAEPLKSDLLDLLGLYWEQDYAAEPALLESFRAHLDYFREHPIPAVAFTTDASRTALEILADRDKSRLANELMRAQMDGVVGNDIDLRQSPTAQGFAAVFRWRGDGRQLVIPGMYTANGLNQMLDGRQLAAFVEQLDGERWLFGDDTNWPASGDLRAELERLYVQDYIRVWQNALDSLEMQPLTDAADSTFKLSILVGSSSPLRLLLQKVAEQTELVKASTQAQTSAGSQAARLAGRTKIGRKFKRLGAAGGEPPPPPRQAITDAFAELNSLSDGGAGLTQVDALLNQLAQLLGPLSTGAPGDPAFNQVRAEAATLTEPVKSWLSMLAAESTQAAEAEQLSKELEEKAEIRQQEESELVGSYRNNVLPLCLEALPGRYPVNPNAAGDLGMSDLRALFAPGGELQQFTDNDLAPFIDRSSRPWKWLESEDYDALALPNSLLSAMQRASEVRRAYFPTPFSLGIEPGDIPAQIAAIEFWIDGEKFEYRQGPLRSYTLNWPGSGEPGVRLIMRLTSGAELKRQYPGTWGLLRALEDAAGVTPHENGGLSVRFDLNGNLAEIIMHPGKASHPFLRNPLENFRCPRI